MSSRPELAREMLFKNTLFMSKMAIDDMGLPVADAVSIFTYHCLCLLRESPVIQSMMDTKAALELPEEEIWYAGIGLATILLNALTEDDADAVKKFAASGREMVEARASKASKPEAGNLH